MTVETSRRSGHSEAYDRRVVFPHQPGRIYSKRELLVRLAIGLLAFALLAQWEGWASRTYLVVAAIYAGVWALPVVWLGSRGRIGSWRGPDD